MSTTEGGVLRTLKVKGSWGIPRIDQAASLSFDGTTLVLAPTELSTTSSFKIVDASTLRVKKTVTLRGNFAFDALSPKAALMYLVQYQGNVGRYVVRAVNLTSGKLVQGRIADKSQKSWVMQGLPVTRVSSADGRFVYTLYANPGGYPFVHVLDTMTKTAHCVGIPWRGGDDRPWSMRLALRDDGKLAVNFGDTGEQYIAIDLSSWKIDYLSKK
jgi:hypothetical protein